VELPKTSTDNSLHPEAKPESETDFSNNEPLAWEIRRKFEQKVWMLRKCFPAAPALTTADS